jgi:hypothetical protein
MFAQAIGFLEDGGSQILPGSHPLSTVSTLPRYTGLGAVGGRSQQRNGAKFRAKMGLVSDSSLQAERLWLNFLVLAKAGGFLERLRPPAA